ncbi:MAG TPA: twin-arginine translocase TatA/TatE family subunit [Cytophagales bacterium]|nr:twin-arginine translocase TatA/TatE family subunit [Cytophagales bacterium]
MVNSTISILGFAGIGGWEVFLILVVFLILFGAKKIPELARGLGKGIREFKDATSNIKNELEEGVKDDKKQ